MIFKSQQGNEVTLRLSQDDIKTLAAEIASAVERAISFKSTATAMGARSFTNTDRIHIDDSIVDISVSMDGIERPEEIILARTNVLNDNIEETKQKLKALKSQRPDPSIDKDK